METGYGSEGAAGAAAGIGAVGMILYLAVLVLILVSYWKIFSKAGKPGWASIVPVYNAIVVLEIVGKPVWWFILLFIPFVNIVIGIILVIEIAKSFGKSGGYVAGLILLPIVFIPMLAFGSAEYIGPGGEGTSVPSTEPIPTPDSSAAEAPEAPEG